LPTGAAEVTSAEALTIRARDVDISTNSWGGTGTGRITGFLSDAQADFDAFAQLTTVNRGGKGAVILFAGGNDGQKLDYCDREEKMASPLVLVIGAVSDQGKHVGYSEPCANVFVTAPSQEQNDVVSRRGIVVPLNIGNSNQCDLDFSGTSAATPVAAGVAALVLEANPNLTYRDVQAVLATTATRVDSGESSWTMNSAGVHHSRKFGFGRVNALAAVQTARTWTNLPAVQTATGSFTASVAIPDGTGAAASTTANVSIPAGAKVEHVLVRLDLDHIAPNQLRIEVESPSGFRSVLVQEFGAGAPFTFNVGTDLFACMLALPVFIIIANHSLILLLPMQWLLLITTHLPVFLPLLIWPIHSFSR
jgi:subtilisin family serine protease